jgi:plasmid stabilization system protein ParE
VPYSVTRAAQSDIEDIVSTIWQDNPEAAEQVEERLYEAFDLLAQNPELGHKRLDLTDRPVRFWPVKRTSYAAIYRIASPIEIIRVVHWRRDIASLPLDESTA